MAKKRTTKSTTYPEGKVQSLSGSKQISEKKFNRKLKKAKEGEVTQNQIDQYGFFGEKTRGFNVKNTNVKKKNNVYIKRETPNSETDTRSYLKVNTKPTREQKKATKYQREQDVENAALSSGASMKKFPEIKKKNEGKFTAWVEKNMGGMDTCKAASKVMRSRTKKYSSAVVKMANYANNFGCKTKKEDGSSVPLKGKQKNLPDALKSKILASDGASMKGKRRAIKELDKKSGEKVKTDRKGNVKKLTLTERAGTLNQSVKTYKGGHVDAKSKTSFTKERKKDKDGNKVKSTVANRSIEGSTYYGNQGKKGKTVVKDNLGKKVYKTNRKGITTFKGPKSKKK